MRDDGLYEKLEASEQRRRVAAILLDAQRDALREHMARNPDPATHVMSIELEIGHFTAVLAALAGDFDSVLSTLGNRQDLRGRINTVLAAVCDSCSRGRCQEQGCDVVTATSRVCTCECKS